METALLLDANDKGEPNIKIPSDPKDIDNDFIEKSYKMATECMKKVSFIWETKNEIYGTGQYVPG
jgi:hypothetical protein